MNLRIARRTFPGVFLLPLLLGVALAARADDWPQWRGPRRDGVWGETGIREQFPPEKLPTRWKTPVGPGFSGPAVAGGRLFLAASRQVGGGGSISKKRLPITFKELCANMESEMKRTKDGLLASFTGKGPVPPSWTTFNGWDPKPRELK